MKYTTLICFCFIAWVQSASGWTVRMQNLNSAENAGYSLFTESGALVSGTLTGNIRVGAFAEGFDVAAAWNTGNIAALEAAFNTASLQGMSDYDKGYNGVFQFEAWLPGQGSNLRQSD